jgi:predicted NUDIX family phosphoesterase
LSEDELVLVVPRRLLPEAAGWRGVRSEGVPETLEIIDRAGEFRPRSPMEHDSSWKQIIPYLVLRDGVDYFLMRRTRAGADSRLHDRYSIGIGGHVNPGDGGVWGGLRREWDEEIEADFQPAFSIVGLLNDDETDVGSVHLGIIYEAHAEGRPVGVKETHKLSGTFADPARVAAVREFMETWSALVFEALESPAQEALR